MKKTLFSIAAAVATVAMAPAANAAITMTTTDTGAGSFTIGFGATELADTFTESFTFDVASGLTGLFSLAATTTGTGTNNVDFSSVVLSGGTLGAGGFSFAQVLANPETRGGDVNIGSGSYRVTFNGTSAGANGSFGGSVAFAAAAVPEPATWGMMILGMGMVGASLRRRNTKVAVTYA